eukprot:521383_1
MSLLNQSDALVDFIDENQDHTPAFTKENLSKKSKKRLIKLCKIGKLLHNGTKSDLIKRLTSIDYNIYWAKHTQSTIKIIKYCYRCNKKLNKNTTVTWSIVCNHDNYCIKCLSETLLFSNINEIPKCPDVNCQQSLQNWQFELISHKLSFVKRYKNIYTHFNIATSGYIRQETNSKYYDLIIPSDIVSSILNFTTTSCAYFTSIYCSKCDNVTPKYNKCKKCHGTGRTRRCSICDNNDNEKNNCWCCKGTGIENAHYDCLNCSGKGIIGITCDICNGDKHAFKFTLDLNEWISVKKEECSTCRQYFPVDMLMNSSNRSQFLTRYDCEMCCEMCWKQHVDIGSIGRHIDARDNHVEQQSHNNPTMYSEQQQQHNNEQPRWIQ